MEPMYKLEVDADQMCRACLTRNAVLKSIFCGEIVDGAIVSMPVVFESVTGIQVQPYDSFPSKLCDTCKHKLIDAYIIRQKCIKSVTLLRQILHLVNNEPAAGKESQQAVAPPIPDEEALLEQSLDEIFAEDETTEYIDVLEEADAASATPYDVEDDESGAGPEVLDVILLGRENIIKAEAEYDDVADEQSTSESTMCMEVQFDVAPSDRKPTKTKPRRGKLGDLEACTICDAYIAKDEMDAHTKDHEEFLPTVIASAQFYRCDNCHIVQPSVDAFVQHLADTNSCHAIAQQYTDAHCCTDYQFLDDPIATVLAGIPIISGKMTSGQAYACFCGFESFEIDVFHEHFDDEHVTGSGDLLQIYKDTCRLSHTCGICLCRFDNLKEAIFHVFHHRSQFQCPHMPCRKMFFKSVVGLRRHIAGDHSNSTVQFCQHCKGGFADQDALKAHMKSECTERKLGCTYCDKKYFHKQALEIHLRNHKSEKKFKCDYCPKTFVQSNDLRNHLRTHTGERPYQCGMCGKSFKTISCRLDHLKTHNADSVVECNVCHKTFKSHRILRGHMRLHADKSFECQFCRKKYFRKYHLKNHMKVHQTKDVFIKNEIDHI